MAGVEAFQHFRKKRYAMKSDSDIIALRQPESVDGPLTEIARDGARRMLAVVQRAEADAFVAQHSEEVLPDGWQRVVRHGYGRGMARSDPSRPGSARSICAARRGMTA